MTDIAERIWLLSDEGILTMAGESIEGVPFRGPATAGHAAGGRVSVIVDEREVWTRTSRGWTKAASGEQRLYCVLHTADGRILVGTESARVALVEDGRLRPIESFDGVPERPLWNTPYGAPPELRSLALGTDGTIYANVHVGWIVRSRDGGKTWASVRKGLDRDVHQVAAHPSDPSTVFAATANGFHISHDHGDSFTRRPKGMPYLYQRATACFPGRDVYLASTAKHERGAGALLFRSEDEGTTWQRVDGIPEVNRNINTYQIGVLDGGRAVVVVEDQALYETGDWGVHWTRTGRGLPDVHAVLVR